MEIKPLDPEFDRVWHRVTRPGGEELVPEGVFTAALRGELARLGQYRALGFAGPARECARRGAQLRRVTFFLEGGAPLLRTAQPALRGSRQELLRGLFLAEGAAENRYRSLAAGMADPILARALYLCADSCARTRQLLWQMIK